MEGGTVCTGREGMCVKPWNQLLYKASPVHMLITWQITTVEPNVLNQRLLLKNKKKKKNEFLQGVLQNINFY